MPPVDTRTKVSDPPITDLRIGRSSPLLMGSMGGALSSVQWGAAAVEEMEYVPQLMWPESVRTYHAMRNDSQVDALLTSVMLPAMRMKWSIAPNKAKDDIVEKIARDYNLPIQGDEPDEDERGFDFGEHLYHALLAVAYGYIFHQQVGEIREDGLWHIQEMGEIMPQAVSEIVTSDVTRKLVGVKTWDMDAYAAPIPIDRLVHYVWQREGTNWVGRSMLRPLYRDWFIKDRLLRINAINIERAGAGLPVIEAPPNATPEQLEAAHLMAQSYKAGENSGGALPAGFKLRLVGVEGQTPDTIKSVNYHDESMARSFLAMFLQLGQTKTGSRALGGEFSDLMAVALEAVASWFAKTFNKNVIRDDIDWNYGPDERQPKIVYETFDNPNLAVADLVSLVSQNIIRVDPEFRAHIRKKYRLPEEDEKGLEEEQKKALERMGKLDKPSDGAGGGGGDPTPGDGGNSVSARSERVGPDGRASSPSPALPRRRDLLGSIMPGKR